MTRKAIAGLLAVALAAGCGGADPKAQVRAACERYVKARAGTDARFSRESVSIGPVRSRATLDGTVTYAQGPRTFMCAVERRGGRWVLVALTGL